MKSIDGTTYAALLAAPDAGICERDFVTFYVRSLDGLTTTMFCFWNDLDTVTASVLRGDTGSAENRDFVGDGSLLSVDRVPLVSDLTIQTVKVTLSQIHATVQDMVRGHDIRGARVEIHRGLFDPSTHAVAGSIYCHFVGKVNKAPIATPKIGDEGSISIDVVSIVRELTRTNPAKKSDETQKRRSGDRFRRYSGVANVPVFWGVEKAKTK
ncbi:hypothetical protein FJ981_28120 [Mesorhizobium sp. B1-1-4]|uniref:hypothetical protein n=1 Tax=Mesorhizobium sp. B1-1-4 TaxID=2589980 RepID=UPI00112844F5|nr:hypothetical protein [Mesorhizobium sp. B1-1-4]TPN44465.1 hypothetical protein FJ981_28120 [Mesorhizobium sp. B1-1-4]